MDSALHACLCASDSFRYWKPPIPSGKIQLNFQWMWKWVTACELPWVRFLTFLMNAIACTWMHWRSKMNSECYLHFDRFHFNWNQCNFQSSSGNSFEWKYCTDSGLNEIRKIPCITNHWIFKITSMITSEKLDCAHLSIIQDVIEMIPMIPVKVLKKTNSSLILFKIN